MKKQTDFNFSVHCFEMPCDVIKGSKYKCPNVKKFWKQIGETNEGLAVKSAKGIYIFALQHGAKITPFYVGQTTKKTFEQEATEASTKLHMYKDCLNGVYGRMRGTPIMIFLVYRTKTGKVSSREDKDLFVWLETNIISLAVKQNANLINTANTKYVKKVCVPGLLNSPQGKLSDAANALKSTLF